MAARTRIVVVNRRRLVATEHSVREDGLTQPQYILQCKAIARLAWMAETPKHFYLGYYETDRVTFEMDGTWWYIDDLELFKLLRDHPRRAVKFIPI
jgi:hypothetical protein